MIRAIETEYMGHRFRSRLEARWAVFFDTLGIAWEYEPEGYELPTRRYLPDFFLPAIAGGTWIEIKADRDDGPKDEETQLMRELVEMTGKRGMVVRGLPLQGSEEAIMHGHYEPPGAGEGSGYWMQFSDGRADGPYLFCTCLCGRVGIEYDGRGDRVCNGPSSPSSPHGDKGYSWDAPKIIKAAARAKAARFEHGETP